MDEETAKQINQMMNALADRIESKLESQFMDFRKRVELDINRVELKVEQRDIALRKEIREQGSRDRDRMEMLKNQLDGFVTLRGGRGPEPPQYVPTGTGLIDPEWRWEREHPFRR